MFDVNVIVHVRNISSGDGGESTGKKMGQSGRRHENAERSERVVNVMKRPLYIWCRVLDKKTTKLDALFDYIKKTPK